MSDSGIPNLTSLTITNPIARDIAAFIGEVARPFAIIITAWGVARATIILAMKVNSPEAAFYIGAVFLGVGTLFGAKAWERVAQTKADATVATAAQKGTTSTVNVNQP